MKLGALNFLWVRRLSLLEDDVFRFGTPIQKLPFSSVEIYFRCPVNNLANGLILFT